MNTGYQNLLLPCPLHSFPPHLPLPVFSFTCLVLPPITLLHSPSSISSHLHSPSFASSHVFKLFELRFRFTGVSVRGLEILQQTNAPMFYLLLCASFTIKSHDYGQDFHFHHKMKYDSADKTLEQRFLKEFMPHAKTPRNLS